MLNFHNSADNVDAPLAGVTFVGTEASGTNASANFNDGVYHQITDTSNDIDIVYEFDVGGSNEAVEFTWIGYVSGSNDECTIQAYNGSTWDTITTVIGQSGTVAVEKVFKLFNEHTGTGANLGKTFLRLNCNAQSTPTVFTDQFIVSAVVANQTVGYDGGAIWIDTNDGTAGTEPYVHGTADNPVLTYADAVTLASNVGLHRFQVVNGSSITFTGTHDAETWIGTNWTLALGGQSLSGTFIVGAVVSGTCTGANKPHFEHCEIGTVTLPPCRINGTSGFTDTMTVGSAGEFDIIECSSLVAGSGSPTIDCGAAIGASNFSVRGWHGGLTFTNIGASDVISMEGIGGTINVNGTGGSINIRGIFEGVVDNSSAAVSINEVATINRASLAGYDGGAVWVDTNGSNSGVLPYVDGTADNPVNNIADATTIAGSIGVSGITKFSLLKGTSITLAQTYTRYIFTGTGGTIALGGQDISFCTFQGHNVSGTGIGAGRTFWEGCRFNGATLNSAAMRGCSLNGTLTLASASDYSFNDCYATDETTGFVLDYATTGNTQANFNRWSGVMEVRNMGNSGADTLTLEGTGKVTFNANCTSGTVYIRGDFEVTNNGSVTITYDDNSLETANINVTSIAGSAAAATNLSLSASTIVVGEAEAGTLSTTEMTTDLTETTDDHYNGRIIIWTSGVLIKQVTNVTDYVGATGKLTYTAVTEAPSAADTFILV